MITWHTLLTPGHVAAALAAVLVVGYLGRWAAHAVGQPPVVGEMAVGMLIGPALRGHPGGPVPAAAGGAVGSDAAVRPRPDGMTRQQLNGLTETLSQDGDGKRGRPPRLDFPEQVLAAVLHLRVALTAEPLAVLFGSSRTAMHRTLLKIRRLLKAHGIVISPAATPPAALTVLQARVRTRGGDPNSKIKTAC
jgi:hypothetical protein